MKKYIFISFLVTCIVIFSAYVYINSMDAVSQPLQSTTTTLQPIAQILQNQSIIKKFSSYDAMKDFFKRSQVSGLDFGFGGGRAEIFSETINMIGAPVLDAQVVTSAAVLKSSSQDYSTTNIQEAGVNEADIIKTDGTYIYVVSGSSVSIIKAHPAENGKILSRIELPGTPKDIYIDSNRLIVFGRDNTQYSNISTDKIGIEPSSLIFAPRYSGQQNTFFKVFDTTDKTKPVQVRDLSFEGNYFNSRKIGDYVYFVTQKYGYNDVIPLPRIWENGVLLSNESNSLGDIRCNCPPVYYFDMIYRSPQFTTITSINIVDDTEQFNNEVYVQDSGQNMYVSQKNIYLTHTRRIDLNEISTEVMRDMFISKLSENDRALVNKIQNIEDDILSAQEKSAKVLAIISRFLSTSSKDQRMQYEDQIQDNIKKKYLLLADELEKTVIHKIAIENGKMTHRAVGGVPGSIIGISLGQFAMSEQGDYFRIATTKNRIFIPLNIIEEEQESSNNIYVLDSDLKIVGSVEGLARGERIFSVRFMQDRAYMVTFKQVDPLFVIDLKDPRDPKVLGELKIPGFSNYLHPYDENTIIGIGKNTEVDEFGRVITKGVKISLFDVSDVSTPKEAANYILGGQGSDSLVLRDHKAFLFDKEKKLLVLPVSLMQKYQQTFSGAAVFKIKKDSIQLRGDISHMASIIPHIESLEMKPKIMPDFYSAQIKRSLYIEDTLYTLSDQRLKANKLSDLSTIRSFGLGKEE